MALGFVVRHSKGETRLIDIGTDTSTWLSTSQFWVCSSISFMPREGGTISMRLIKGPIKIRPWSSLYLLWKIALASCYFLLVNLAQLCSTLLFFWKNTTFCLSHLFLSFAAFFILKRCNFFSLASFSLSSYTPDPSYPPELSALIRPSYSSVFLILPNLTNQLIKLSDGDLQCEWNSDIFIRLSFFTER